MAELGATLLVSNVEMVALEQAMLSQWATFRLR